LVMLLLANLMEKVVASSSTIYSRQSPQISRKP
jgi:hypothetical protein